jgi:hypothetical protein
MSHHPAYWQESPITMEDPSTQVESLLVQPSTVSENVALWSIAVPFEPHLVPEADVFYDAPESYLHSQQAVPIGEPTAYTGDQALVRVRY